MRVILVLAVFAMAFFNAWTTPVQAQQQCDRYRNIRAHLQDTFKEYPVSRGMTDTASVYEIFASDEGSWTAVIVRPNGMACLVGSGKAWEIVTPKKGTAL